MAKIPKILKIYKKEYPVIGCIFSNGEARLINLKELFDHLGIIEGDFGYVVVKEKSVFDLVELEDYTLTWNNVRKTIQLPKGDPIEVNFQLAPDVLYENSTIDHTEGLYEIGPQLKRIRKSLRLTLDELAKRIGTTKHSLSRIESGATDPEFNTLRKIFEVGFGKKFMVLPYDENDLSSYYTQTALSSSFEEWLQENHSRVDLIAGIDNNAFQILNEGHIDSVNKISRAPFNILYDHLKASPWPIDSFGGYETWGIQARYIEERDWYGLIGMQRRLDTPDKDQGESKIERVAKEELGEDIWVLRRR